MTNAEKFLKDGVDVKEFNKELFKNCVTGELFNYINTTAVINWLNSEVKPILSEGEKVILKNAHSPNGTIAYYVGRNEDTKNLFMRTKYDPYQYDWGCFDALFQFIQPRRTI